MNLYRRPVAGLIADDLRHRWLMKDLDDGVDSLLECVPYEEQLGRHGVEIPNRAGSARICAAQEIAEVTKMTALLCIMLSKKWGTTAVSDGFKYLFYLFSMS